MKGKPDVIEIKKVPDGYSVHATPPHVHEEWRSPNPMTVDELIAELRSRGAHTTDISDAFHEADPDWLSR